MAIRASPPRDEIAAACWYTARPMSDQSGFDPKRRLCPDGSCTGVIGQDGRCGDCGRTAAGGNGSGAPRSVSVPADEPALDGDGDGDGNGADDQSAAAETAAPGSAGAGFDPKRRLCDDGACVGVVGSDAKCTVCGRVAS